MLKETPGGNSPYPYVSLCKNNIATKRMVHRLVAETLIPNPENKKEFHHIDGNTYNHHPFNLRWIDREENIQEMYRLSGLGPKRNQKSVKLFYKEQYIKRFDNITEACKFASEKGCSFTGLQKYRKSGDFKIIKCND